MGDRKYKRLCYADRVRIDALLNEKRTLSYIAKTLKRSRSTISREVNKMKDTPADPYDALLNQYHAEDEKINKRNGDKLYRNPRLKIFVYRGLLERWSPDAISGRLKVIYPNDPSMHISHEAIYQHLYRHRQAKLNRKLISLLTLQKTYRHRVNAQSKRSGCIKDRRSIDERPKHIDWRLDVGHWEGDLIIGPNQKSCMGTLIERKTRYVQLIKLPNKKADIVQASFASKINRFPSFIRRTMTYDNGVEMAHHKKLEANTGMAIYFAHPYHSWERGSNENMNGVIRRFLPKSTDLREISQSHVNDLERRLNNRPRKVLGYKTPLEKMSEEYKLFDHDDGVLGSGNKSVIYS